MRGEVDQAGRALLTLQLRANETSEIEDLIVWVDTAFDGELVVPRRIIERLGLSQSAAVQATLADGTQVVLETFNLLLEWFGHWRPVEVIANDGRMPLLGVGMLRGRKLVVDYRSGDLMLE